MAKATLLSALSDLRAQMTWPEFEDKTGIPRSQISRVMSKDITLTPDMAARLAKVSKRSARSWMLLWVDRYYDEVPVQSLHSRKGDGHIPQTTKE